MMEMPLASYVSSLRVGDATVTVISEGSALWAPRFQAPEEEWRRAVPEADAEGRIRIWFNTVHLGLADASVLMDPGLDDPGTVWDTAFGARWGEYRRTPGLLSALTALGVRVKDVTHVVITHAHDDHFAGVAVERDGMHAPRFPRARHLIGLPDWRENPRRGDAKSDLALRLGSVERAGLLDLIEREHDLAPGITIIPAPGETPGHCVARLRSAGEAFFYVGDLFHHACEVEHPAWMSPGRDEPGMRASRDWLLAEASASGATIVFTHEAFPPWGRVVPRGGAYRWERITPPS